MRSRLCLAVIAFLVLASCRTWNPAAPQHTQSGEPTVTQSLSTVRIPISANTAEIARAVQQSYAQKPVSAGRTGEINATLLVEKKITREQAEQVLVQAAIPGACEIKQVPRQVKTGVNCVADAVNCVVKLFHKCGQVCTDVFKTVTDAVKVCAADQAAVYRTEMKPVIDLQQAIMPTTIWVNHDIRLRDLQLTVNGNHASVTANFPITVWVDVSQGLLGANVTVKGALRCEAMVSASTGGDIHLTPEAKVDVGLTEFSMDWKNICIPGAVQAFDIAKYLSPTVLLGTAELKKVINKAILEKLNGAIQDASGQSLDFSAALQKAGTDLQSPRVVGRDAILLIHPSRILASDLVGSGTGAANTIQITVGIEAKPEIVLGQLPPQPTPTPIPFSMTDLGSQVFIDARGSVALSVAQEKLKVALDELISQKYADKKIEVSKIELYQSGPNIAIAVTVERTTGLFRELGTIYLLGTPELSVDGREVDITGIHFDVESKNVLLKVAAWLLDGRVEIYLEQHAKFSIAGQLTTVSQQLSNFSVKSPIGTLSGKISTIRPQGIWVANGSLWAEALASGEASFSLSPDAVIH